MNASKSEEGVELGRAPNGPGPDPKTFTAHDYEEKQVDLGEIVMNYAEAGDPAKPALMLIPGQSESWWGYEQAMKLLETDFHVFAVDLRGQGRSTWTPGRYTFDNIGNDLVRFIALVVRRPVVVSGNSSGGILAAWLSAYALPGQVRGALLEDPPLFAGEIAPAYGHPMRQAAGPVLELFRDYIGDQWSIGDWRAFSAAAKSSQSGLARLMGSFEDPPQNFKEYDPEWSRAFLDDTMSSSLRHERLLNDIKTPVLLTHHARAVDPKSGNLIGAMSDFQAEKVGALISATGAPFEFRSVPNAMHAMHATDPSAFAGLIREWEPTLPRTPGVAE